MPCSVIEPASAWTCASSSVRTLSGTRIRSSATWRPISGAVVAIWPSCAWGPPRWQADPPPPARPPGRATLGWRVGPASGRRALRLQPVAVAAEVQRAQLLARLSDQVALADQDLVGLCRFPRYAERFPRSPAERRSRARKIGITLGRPVNATPLVTVWRLIAQAGLAPVRALAPRPSRSSRWRRAERLRR